MNLLTIIAWNFVFLMLAEFWFRILNTSYAGTLSNNEVFELLIVAGYVGLAVMIVLQYKFATKTLLTHVISLSAIILFFGLTIAYFFGSPYDPANGNFWLIFLSLLILPTFIAGIFTCVPFDFQNNLFDLIKYVFVLVDIVVLLGSNLVFPNLLTLVERNAVFPTVYLLNIVFLGMMFVFHLLKERMPVPTEESEKNVESSAESV